MNDKAQLNSEVTDCKWHIATDEGNYYGEFDSKEDAIKGGKAEGYDIFYVGKERAPDPLSSGVFADWLSEQTLENLEEDWGLDFVHFGPTKEQVEDLQQRLRTVVDQWITEQKLEPTWFLIDDVERIEL